MVEGQANLPGLCPHCREVVTVNTLEDPLRGSESGRKPTLFMPDNPDEFDEGFDPQRAYEFPRCARHTPHLEFVGLWD
jgi:hypothetical protein